MTSLVGGAITSRILRCALEVHRALGPGLLENAYRTCLVWELHRAAIPVQMEVELPAYYKGLRLETSYRADLIVDDQVIVELKSVERLLPVHDAQLLTYLRLSGFRIGLLVNFNSALLKHGIRRLVL